MTVIVRKNKSSQAGITLLEILISMSLGIFMLAGIISLLASVSNTRSELARTSAQIENGRYAIQLIGDEVALAGFFGRYSPDIGVGRSTPDACATVLANLGFDAVGGVFPSAIQGYSDSSVLDCVTAEWAAADSEGLTIRRVGIAPTTTDAQAAAIATPYLQISSCAADANELVFSATGADFTLQNRECTALAEAWPYISRTFFITPCEVCDGTDTRPTLKVAEYANGALSILPLVNDIEDMHFKYGLDLDGDGATDCYADDPTVDNGAADFPADCSEGGWSDTDSENWGNVVSLQIYLLARSETAILSENSDERFDLGRPAMEGPFNDRFRRQVFTATVSIPNVAAPRE